MKRLLSILALGIFSAGNAQNVGNEWINFNQTYYKIPVAQNGIYRITYDNLLSVGFPVATADARKIQLFHRGNEQSIEVVGEGDARLDQGDYIEFYGQRNDGTLDTFLYDSINAQPHKFYNLYSDTTVYFLTTNIGADFGKRITPEFFKNNTAGLPEEAFHFGQNPLLNTSSYAEGLTSLSHTNKTTFDFGEGWTGPLINEGSATNWDDSFLTGATNLITTFDKPRLDLVVVGRNNRTHSIRISVGPSSVSLREVNTYVLDNFRTLTLNEEIEWTDLSASGDLVVRTEILKNFGGNSLVSVSYANLAYPRDFDIGSQQSAELHLAANTGGESFVRIRNVPGGLDIYDITDKDNIQKIGYLVDGTDVTAVIPGTTSGKTLLLNGAGFLVPAVVERFTFRNIDPAQHNYLIVSHRDLMKPAGNSTDAVESYAAYRASAAGGSFDTLVVPMSELYNQFSYGEKSPLSIYNFARFMFENGSPRYLFLIGKGLNIKEQYHRGNPQAFTYHDLVPTAGSPGADMAFTASLGADPFVPEIPVGRITASTAQDIINYLDKVIDYETLEFDQLWKKQHMHLSGGITAAELTLFRSYMDGFGSVAAGDFLGASTTTVQKETNQVSAEINVAQLINEGVNFITFFGHSAPDVTDIDIGFVTDDNFGYNNPLRYPTFLMNGCNAGAIFNHDLIFGEDWILAADRGAVGFVAHSAFGFANNLRAYSDTFYEVAFGDSVFVNRSIGEVQKETARRYLQQNSPTAIVNIAQAQQMVLMGDPAIKLFAADKPDYETTDSNLFLESFDGSPVNALADSIRLGIIIRNFGRTTEDSTTIALKRTLTSGGTTLFDSLRIPPVLFQDTTYITVQLDALNSFGNNLFEVSLDANSEIDELSESNNNGQLNFFIPLNATANLFPINFSIASAQNIKLLAQTANPINGGRDIEFEIDTTKSFNSAFRQTTIISDKIVAGWDVTLLDPGQVDSTVYYWRTRFSSPLPGESTAWAESSFYFVNGGPQGWAQADFPQFDDNLSTGLNRNPGSKQWSFKQNQLDLFVQTYGTNNVEQILDVRIDNSSLIVFDANRRCRVDAINGMAFDKATLSPYAPLSDLELGIPPEASETCGIQPQVINNFTNTQIGAGQLALMIDEIADGDQVLLFSLGNVQYDTWDAALKLKLEEVGATSTTLNALANGEPYILLGEKGANAGTAIEIVGADTEQIQLTQTLSGSFTSGTIASPQIGPAASWTTLHYDVNAQINDTFSFDVIGIRQDGTSNVVSNNVSSTNFDLSAVDAATYPRLRLESTLQDDTDLTVPQLALWQIDYEPVPDGLLFFQSNNQQGSLSSQLNEGEQLQSTFGFVNLSSIGFTDSLVIDYSTFNTTSRVLEASQLKIGPVATGDTAVFNININTLNKVGENDFQVIVNANGPQEQYAFNNTLAYSNYFTVIKDNTNPLLDVVFDGEYILDGDVVSPSPLISIKLLDENNLIRKEDTTGVTIFLKQVCDGCQFVKISFSSPEVQWQPATADADFAVQYQPNQLQDGLYTLSVQATDGSGNKAGVNPYEINFRVVNESTITNFYTYPNPFSTSTRFIFTLTGSEIPTQIKIQIMTVTGKIVREITQDELGPLRIGNNISDFAWDGRDDFGDQLANGVYLYKVTLGGTTSMEHRQTSADKAFKNGFGKIYLLR